MSILFDSGKLSNRSRSRLFGLGLDPRPERLPLGPTDADRAWAAYHLNADAHDYDVVCRPESAIDDAELAWLRGFAGLDERAGDAAAVDAMGRGLPLM